MKFFPCFMVLSTIVVVVHSKPRGSSSKQRDDIDLEGTLLGGGVNSRFLQVVKDRNAFKLSGTTSTGRVRGGAGSTRTGSSSQQMTLPIFDDDDDDDECNPSGGISYNSDNIQVPIDGCPSPPPPSIPVPDPLEIPTPLPSSAPSEFPIYTDLPTDGEVTYKPGELNVIKEGLILSEGLDAKLLAKAGKKVQLTDGTETKDKFHEDPDAGACFVDVRPGNVGGWIYVSNSEVDFEEGGVGALTFDRYGNLINYEMILKKTSDNCGGGKTPWNTWVTCEEVSNIGQIYQVDPYGIRKAEVITLGKEGGRWESFAYDVRNRNIPRFFATEDHEIGALRRFTPDEPNWDDPWEILHGKGVVDYLVLHPNGEDDKNNDKNNKDKDKNNKDEDNNEDNNNNKDGSGTFEWRNDLDDARKSAFKVYPETEGVVVYDNLLYVVSKAIKTLFILNLDDGTYTSTSTKSGLFDGEPDTITRILGERTSSLGNNENEKEEQEQQEEKKEQEEVELLYFTEEEGDFAGVHARDSTGQFYTIFESHEYETETTGVAFSPDGRFMYVAYQDDGILFAIWRNDGRPFYGTRLDVKYHIRRDQR